VTTEQVEIIGVVLTAIGLGGFTARDAISVLWRRFFGPKAKVKVSLRGTTTSTSCINKDIDGILTYFSADASARCVYRVEITNTGTIQALPNVTVWLRYSGAFSMVRQGFDLCEGVSGGPPGGNEYSFTLSSALSPDHSPHPLGKEEALIPRGEHVIHWQVTAGDGSCWPCRNSAPTERWGAIPVRMLELIRDPETKAIVGYS
jgi:hypothetical protein